MKKLLAILLAAANKKSLTSRLKQQASKTALRYILRSKKLLGVCSLFLTKFSQKKTVNEIVDGLFAMYEWVWTTAKMYLYAQMRC